MEQRIENNKMAAAHRQQHRSLSSALRQLVRLCCGCCIITCVTIATVASSAPTATDNAGQLQQ